MVDEVAQQTTVRERTGKIADLLPAQSGTLVTFGTWTHTLHSGTKLYLTFIPTYKPGHGNTEGFTEQMQQLVY